MPTGPIPCRVRVHNAPKFDQPDSCDRPQNPFGIGRCAIRRPNICMGEFEFVAVMLGRKNREFDEKTHGLQAIPTSLHSIADPGHRFIVQPKGVRVFGQIVAGA